MLSGGVKCPAFGAASKRPPGGATSGSNHGLRGEFRSSRLNLDRGECVLVAVRDRDAEEFCNRMRLRLVGALVLMCGDRGVAEQLAQDTLVRVWERWGHVSQMESPEGWMFRTGFNLAASWRRRRQAEWRANRRASAATLVQREPDLADVEAVRRSVASLPTRQRAVIVARFYLGYDVAGAASLLGCSPGTVKAATHQALANLRRAGLVPLEQEVEAT
ncbi:MAG TPA: sigma-70 family RNA polymerase sigma factor [Acidimicrobiales bacterium]|nr:sigma-70 family RNA polymerase sigma factor [Acidimicrobiales bacterium]